MRRRELFDPRSTACPVYWFPIVAPLALGVLGWVGDFLSARATGSPQPLALSTLTFSAFKNVQLAYAATDIWAFTVFAQAGFTGRLRPGRGWVFVLAAALALVVHTLGYVVLAVIGPRGTGLALGALGFVVGTAAVLLERTVAFDWLEAPDLARIDA